MDLKASRLPLIDSARDAEEARAPLSNALERERAATIRAEKLSRANALLRECAERLGAIADVDEFLGQVLLAMTEMVGAHSSTVWTYDLSAGQSMLRYEVVGGRAVPASLCDHPNAGVPVPFHNHPLALMDGHGTALAQPHQRRIAENPGLYDEQRQYLLDLGIVSMIAVPMVLAGKHMGDFTLRLTEDRPLLDVERELVMALANQAAVALHLTTLAEQAKQTAVAVEREAAAKTRADKLAQANALLRESAERLGVIDDIDAFLGQVLLSITQLLGADSSSVWVDNEEHTLSWLRYVVEDGRVVPAAASHHPNAKVPGKLTPAKTAVLAGYGTVAAQPVLHDVATTTGMESELQRDYLQSLGVKALLSVPMVLNGRHLGNFNIRLNDDRALLEDERELIQALANQAAVALHLTRLADEAKQAAVAREREAATRRRAEALASANRVIHASLTTLENPAELDRMLGAVLTVIVEQVNGVGGGIWLTDQHGIHELHTDYLFGRLQPKGESAHPAMRMKLRTDELMTKEHRVARFFEAVQHTEAQIAVAPSFEPYRDYLASVGARSVLSIPLYAAETYLGNVTVRGPNPEGYSVEEIEFAQTLANQASLALHIARLAEQARQSSIAREQEQAAREQVAELERANAAISRTIDALAREHSVDAFLATTMKAMAEALDTPSLAMWLYRDGMGHLHLIYEHGRTVPGSQSDHPNARTPNPLRLQSGAHIEDGSLRRTPTFRVVGGEGAHWQPAQIEYLRAKDVRGLVEGVMVVEDRVIGAFTARILEGQPDPSPARMSLVQALTNQAALALEMTRLAEEAKAAEVTRERLAVVSRANDALRRTADKLADEPALDAFLGQALQSLVDAFGGFGGGFWRRTEDGQVELVLELDRGAMRVIDQSAHPVRQSFNLANPEYATHEQRLLAGDILCLDVAQDYGFAPETQAYLLTAGVSSLVIVPLSLGERHLGRFSIRLHEARSLSAEDQELARALATQAAMAMELTRLADEAKQAALIAEQKRAALEQVAELSKANAAMRESLDEIAQAKNLESLRPTVLGALIKALGAVEGSLWRYNADDGSVTLDREFAEGEFRSRGDSGFQHAERHHFLPSHPASYEKHHRLIRGETLVMDVATSDMFVLNEREHLLAQGVKTLVVMPIEAAGRHLGRLSLAFAQVRQLSASEFELAKALTSQAGLVLEATRLAEDARQAAVARERELAALSQVAELERANVAISATIDSLAKEQSVDAFLATTLKALAEVLEAPSLTLWIYKDGWAHLYLVHDRGTTLSGEQSNHPNAGRPFRMTSRAIQRNADGSPKRAPFVYDVGGSDGEWTPAQIRHLREQGVRAIAEAVMVVEERVAGSIMARLVDGQPDPSPARLSLLQAMTNQVALALELKRLGDEARDAAAARATLNERNRIAGDIHDSLAQAFVGIVMQLGALEAQLEQGATNVQARIARVKESARYGLGEARRSVLALRPVDVEVAGLEAALRALVQRNDGIGKTRCLFTLNGRAVVLDQDMEDTLLRVAQEGLANAIKYAKADQVAVSLNFSASEVQLVIADDGIGIPEFERRERDGLGLMNMQHRAEQLGGTFEIESTLDEGTQLTVTLPLPSREAEVERGPQ